MNWIKGVEEDEDEVRGKREAGERERVEDCEARWVNSGVWSRYLPNRGGSQSHGGLGPWWE